MNLKVEPSRGKRIWSSEVNRQRNITDAARERKRRWQANHYDSAEQIARRQFRTAIEHGQVQRKYSCDVCGNKQVRQDGVTAIQGHHHKGLIEFPLDVQWLCTRCHKKAHDALLKEKTS